MEAGCLLDSTIASLEHLFGLLLEGIACILETADAWTLVRFAVRHVPEGLTFDLW